MQTMLVVGSHVAHMQAPVNQIAPSDCFSFSPDVVLMAETCSPQMITANVVWRSDGGALGSMKVPVSLKVVDVYRLTPTRYPDPQGTIRTFPSFQDVYATLR